MLSLPCARNPQLRPLPRRLMGRSASHITVECALQTRPQLALVSEEVAEKRLGMQDLAAQAGRHFLFLPVYLLLLCCF